MKKHSLFAVVAAAALVGLGACTNELRLPQSEAEINEDIHNSRFDFNTWVKVPVTVNVGRQAYVRIYDCDPDLNRKATPIYTMFTDKATGSYTGTMEVPCAVIDKECWAVCHGVKISATVSLEGVTFNNPNPISRYLYDASYADEVKKTAQELSDLYHDKLPAGRDNSDLLPDDQDANFTTLHDRTIVTLTLVDGGDQYYNRLYYYYYPSDKTIQELWPNPQDFFATFCQDKFLVTSNVIVDERYDVSYNNGYFYRVHEGTQVLADPDDYMLQFERLDDGGRLADFERNRLGFINNSANGKLMGKQATIGFYGEDYSFGQEWWTEFPAGYTIGFMLVTVEELYGKNPGTETVNIFLPSEKFYQRTATFTDKNIGSIVMQTEADGSGGATSWTNSTPSYTRYGAGFIESNGVEGSTGSTEGDVIYNMIYGFEDDSKTGGDRDFDDVMFLVSSDQPVRTGMEVVYWGRIDKKGRLLFEDNYPAQGDYDMNDLIVDYEYTIGYSHNDDVVYFYWKYTPTHYGANYTNDFWMGYTPLDRDATGAAIVKDRGNAIHAREVFKNGKANLGKTFMGYARAYDEGDHAAFREYQGTQDLNAGDEYLVPESERVFFYMLGENRNKCYGYINPFIYVQNTGYEVHLTDMPWCKVGKLSDDFYAKRYHAPADELSNKEGVFPWAADISSISFIPASEKVRISVEYPYFLNWAESKGTRYTNWYNRRKN